MNVKKDSYYFSHDANARNDVKCIRLRRELGLEGYGIYWCLIEMLREEPGHRLPVSNIEDIAYGLHTSKEKIEAVVVRYELFEVDDQDFFSPRLLRSMQQYSEIKLKLSESGKKGAAKRLNKPPLSQAEATLKPPLSIKGNKRKEKVNEIEIKKEEIKESLSAIEINSTIEFIGITEKRELNTEEVQDYWNAFKIHSEGKFYANHSEMVQHFRNWLKKQDKPKNGLRNDKTAYEKHMDVNRQVKELIRQEAGI
jgi:hypothetical protein